MGTKCKHNFSDKLTACDDMCPLCLAADIIKFNDRCLETRRRLEDENKALHKDILKMNELLAATGE